MKTNLPPNPPSKRPFLNGRLFLRPGRMFVFLLIFAGTIHLFVNNSWESSAGAAAPAGSSQDGIWSSVDEGSISIDRTGKRVKAPRGQHRVRVDKAALARVLSQAPMEFSEAASRNRVEITLPMPDRTFARFWIEESPIMEASLAAQFPEIKTYRGQGIDDPTATTRFDWTPKGFHAMVLSASGTVYVNPFGSDREYISSNKSDLRRDGETFHCLVDDTSSVTEDQQTADVLPNVVTNAGTLHTYRLAVAATAEYTSAQGGTVPLALAAINTTINRVNGIYERELSIRMVLIANETTIIHTDTDTDDYTNGDVKKLIDENTTNLNKLIGSGSYDIGHVFGTETSGGDGLARAGVCGSEKASGVTGHSTPSGDGFDVDFVAHEMGHQFGAKHTFNGTTGSCGNLNQRTAASAYEPGSGSTIMAYAGICGAENLQLNSDDYFHVKSLEQIVAFVATHSCDVETSTGNVAPVILAGPNYTIPIGTPFTLTASGNDANGDALTFAWEEYDLGTQSPPFDDDGSRPIFRSFNPTVSPARIFPKLSAILSNTSSKGETLPTTNRTMVFQVTARDNRGGVNSAAMQVTATDNSGPFTVTQPNTAVVWTTGTTETVTWNVANTTAAPVSCAEVKISLSLDGGKTFFLLNARTPNDGSETVTVPFVPSGQARIKVEGFGNIFFDISDRNFIINAPPEITCPTNIVTSTDPGACSAVRNFTPTVTDIDKDVDINCTPASGTAFPKGTTTVQCVATDPFGATDSCSFTITVNDTENPVISCPANIVTGNDPGMCSAIVNPGTATATDNCSVASITGARSDGLPLNAPYPVGATTILWKATDTSNNTVTCTQTIIVNDVEAPVITASVADSCLWSPNHNLVDVGLSLAVVDNCSPLSAIAIAVRVTSDEKPEIDTQGDGMFSPDAVVTGSGVNQVVRLRAERMGGGDGRVYLVHITATDQYNNTALKVLRVGVPANQSLRTDPFTFCAIDSRPVPGSNAPDGGFFAQSPPALIIGRKQ